MNVKEFSERMHEVLKTIEREYVDDTQEKIDYLSEQEAKIEDLFDDKDDWNKYDVIDNVITALYYQRENSYLVEVIKEVIERFEDIYEGEWSDDGNTIHCMIILTYGDYGTSPRTGWFYEEEVKYKVLCRLYYNLFEMLTCEFF